MPYRQAQLTSTATIAWTDGSAFDGYLIVYAALPSSYEQIAINSRHPKVRLPSRWKIPIVEGVYHTAAKLPFTADLEPPNVKYAAWWFDLMDTQIGGPSSLFSVTATPYTLNPPTLTAPSASVSTPTLEELDPTPSSGGSGSSPLVVEVPTGAVNGVNTAFAVSGTPDDNALLVFKNGISLIEGLGWTVSGSTITFLTDYIPQTGDIVFVAYTE